MTIEKVDCELHDDLLKNYLEFNASIRGFYDGDKLVYHKTSNGSLILKALWTNKIEDFVYSMGYI